MRVGAALLACLACLAAAAADDARDNRIPDEALAILEQAGQLTVYSIDPVFPKTKPREDLHGWRVLGHVVVTEAGVRAGLVTALKRGADQHRGDMMRCFIPRHAVRATHGGRTADIVICFECYNARVYVDDRQLPGFMLTQTPEPAFERVLAGVKASPARQR